MNFDGRPENGNAVRESGSYRVPRNAYILIKLKENSNVTLMQCIVTKILARNVYCNCNASGLG